MFFCLFSLVRCYTLKYFISIAFFVISHILFSLFRVLVSIFFVFRFHQFERRPLFTACKPTHNTRIHQKIEKNNTARLLGEKERWIFVSAPRDWRKETDNLRKNLLLVKKIFFFEAAAGRKKKNVDVDSGWRKNAETTSAIFEMSLRAKREDEKNIEGFNSFSATIFKHWMHFKVVLMKFSQTFCWLFQVIVLKFLIFKVWHRF